MKFQELDNHIERNRHLAIKYACAFLPVDDAEDAVQKAYLRAFELQDQFDRSRPFNPWFLSILKYVCMNDRRGMARTTKDLSVEEIDSGDNTLDTVIARTLSQRIVSAISELDSDSKIVFVARFCSHMSEKEVAEIVGVTPRTVRARAARARTVLKPKVREILA